MSSIVPRVQPGVGGHGPGGVDEDRVEPGRAAQEVGVRDAPHHGRHDVLIPPDPLQVRAQPDVPFPPERQSLGAHHVMDPGRQVEARIGIADGRGQADPHAAVGEGLVDPVAPAQAGLLARPRWPGRAAA